MLRVKHAALCCRAAVAALPLVLAGAAPAVVTSFTGLGDGTSWTDANNWDNSEPNGATFDAVIDGSVGNPFDVLLSAGRVVNTLTLGDEDVLRFANNAYLEPVTDIDNAGTLRILATTTATTLRIETALSLDGGGTVEMSGNNARIYDVTLSADGHLTNVDNLIHGQGAIGLNRTTVTNHATIRADVDGAILAIDPDDDGMINDGLLEASDGGILRLDAGVFTNTGGTIRAQDDSIVRFYAGPAVTDGTLQTLGTGVIETGDPTLATLTDVTLDGDLRINNSHAVQLVGTFTNNAASTLLIDATVSATSLTVESDVSLTGGGTVELSGGNARLWDATGDALGHLTNVDNLIHGQGGIGLNRLQITNHGTIRADVSGQTLTLDPGDGGMTNDALLEASGGGVLRLDAGDYTNTGGTIRAQDTSSVQLYNGPAIANGTLQTVGSGVIETGNASLASLTDVTLNGKLRIANSCNVELLGTFTNNPASLLLIDATVSATDLVIETPVTLTGGGTIRMSGANARLLDESGLADTGHLTNQDNLIHGQGWIGGNRMQLTNHGTIRADVGLDYLNVDPGAGGLANDSLLEASGAGILRLYDGTYNNLGGTIRAGDASSVQFINGPAITDGTFQTTGSGVIESGNANTATLTNVTLDGLMRINNACNIELKGTFHNNPTSELLIAATVSATDLRIETPVTLTGGGSVRMSGANARILDEGGDADTGHLVNQDNLIHGQGWIGGNRTQLTNHGTIRADVNADYLTLDPGTGGITNDGLLEATGAGILRLGSGTYSNAGGVIRAQNASNVQLLDGPVITGGTFQTVGTGVIETGNSYIAVLSGVTLDGLLRINNANNVELQGTFINNPASVLMIDSSVSGTTLRVESDVTLSGGGTVEMAGPYAFFYDVVGDPLGHLTNDNNLIHGRGNVGANRTRITNHGTIRADVPGQLLILEPNDQGLRNDALMEAAGGGILRLDSGTFDNTSGVIRAQDGSSVQLFNGTMLSYGLLESVGSGVIETASTNTAVLTDLALDGTLRINNSHNLELIGTLDNRVGSMLLIGSGASATRLRIESEVTLAGGGEVWMPGGNAFVYDVAGANEGHLINQDNLMHGRGNLGANRTRITNQGTIRADVNGATLTIDVDPRGLTNTGTLAAEAGATLYVVDGFANDGVIVTEETGTVRIDGALTNNAGGTLAGDGLIRMGSTGAQDVVNHGDIAPGASIGSLMLDVGTLTFGATGRFSVELGGTLIGDEHDGIGVDGNVVLGGTLDVSLVPGFVPAIGDSFDILMASSSLTGTFDTVNLPAGPGEGFAVVYTSNYVRLTVLRLDGDLSGDGFVGISDLNLVLGNWNQTVPPGDLLSGDPSGDGYVGIADLNFVLGNWNIGTPPPPLPTALSTPIPEPGAVVWMLLGAVGLMRRRD